MWPGYNMFFSKQCWHLVSEWTLGLMNVLKYHWWETGLYLRKLQHVGHKWVICGSNPDCSMGQWVKWVNRCDPLSTLMCMTISRCADELQLCLLWNLKVNSQLPTYIISYLNFTIRPPITIWRSSVILQ